jgi:hypothetical protein
VFRCHREAGVRGEARNHGPSSTTPSAGSRTIGLDLLSELRASSRHPALGAPLPE